MSKKHPKSESPYETTVESPFEAFSSESARQRWELFHRAIAHAKENNSAALDDSEECTPDTESASPLLTLVR